MFEYEKGTIVDALSRIEVKLVDSSRKTIIDEN